MTPPYKLGLSYPCSEAAIRKWIYQRRLPAVKVGRLTRLRVSDLEALLVKGLPGR